MRQRDDGVRHLRPRHVSPAGDALYDRDGNLTRRELHERFTTSAWSNPLTGASLPYTQNNVTTNLLAVPGDFDSATETIRGEVIIHGQTAAPAFIAVGRQVFNSDES